ncbi:MAG: hypothetical protein KKF89_05100 [Nanoarchaeota archaeon]|nr:hypothetical protein [Nanoarchaeota archaeon]
MVVIKGDIMVIVGLMRRHEKTAKDSSGKKLDKPTKEGLANAYGNGMLAAENYPGFKVSAHHSIRERAFLAAQAWLMGYLPKGNLGAMCDKINYDPHLDSFSEGLSKEVKEPLRNMKDPVGQYQLVFNQFNDEVNASGTNVAKFVIKQMRDYMNAVESTGFNKNLLDNSVTHGPIIDVGYINLIRPDEKAVTFDDVVKHTGMIVEGNGFNTTLRKDGNLYLVDIDLVNPNAPQGIQTVTQELSELVDLYLQ